MAATKPTVKATVNATGSTESVKQITYLAAALKAPRITEAAARFADQARDAGWTHEDHLAAVLERDVSARNASGARLRIRAAGFPAVKTLEDFDFDAQPAVRQQVGALASGGFLTEARNVVLLGPPGTGKTHLATALGVAAARHGHRVLFATATDWVTRLTDAHRAGRLPNELARLRRYGLIIVDLCRARDYAEEVPVGARSADWCCAPGRRSAADLGIVTGSRGRSGSCRAGGSGRVWQRLVW
jgi:DNA replication protein DnaC